MRTALLSGAAGFAAAVLGWSVAIAMFANYPHLELQGIPVEWGGMLAVCTGLLVVFVTAIMKRQLDPLLTATAGLAGAALLFNVRELPVAGMQEGSTGYWVIVVGLVGLFVNMVISLRTHRNDGR